MHNGSDLPRLAEPTRWQLLASAIWIAMALVAVTVLGRQIALHADLRAWWVLPALVAGMAAADFASGIVHWAADTWGSDDLPLIGPRLLVPFRVHHVNPDDFLRRRFLDTNGDVALATMPVLLALLLVPLDARWGQQLALFGFGLCAVGMMTNQMHQWAHMTAPPLPVRVLQHCRLILRHRDHRAHHAHPYDTHYCITTGWCNGILAATGFFRRLEGAVTRLTRWRPRADDRLYERRYGSVPGDVEAV
jgi:plasmanylethanolamine desaturase